MSKLLTKSILIITGFTTAVLLWLQGFSANAYAPVVQVFGQSVEELQSALEQLVLDQYSTPTKISIPSVNIVGTIEPVGVEQSGAMEVPSSFSSVGWLKTSSKIGQGGNLVLSGHFDTTTGSPAVFYNLPSVKTGEKIIVSNVLQSGAEVTKEYVVTKVYLAEPENKEHVKEAYKKTKHPTITLITCNGIWDYAKQEYSHRVVVKGELIN